MSEERQLREDSFGSRGGWSRLLNTGANYLTGGLWDAGKGIAQKIPWGAVGSWLSNHSSGQMGSDFAQYANDFWANDPNVGPNFSLTSNLPEGGSYSGMTSQNMPNPFGASQGFGRGFFDPNSTGAGQYQSVPGYQGSLARENEMGIQNITGGPLQGPGSGYDWGQLQQMLFGGGSGGSGGGSGGSGGGGQGVGAQGYLQGLYGGGQSIGGFDPSLMTNIEGLQGQTEGNYSQFQNLLTGLGSQYAGMIGGEDILSQLLGGAGGSSGGGGFYSGGGSSGPGLNIPEFDPGDIRTSLANLDPETLAQLQSTTDSRIADFENIRSAQNDDLLLDLFGRGVNRSTVAGEALNRANESQERSRLAILSDADQRALGLRTELSDRNLQADLGTLGARAQTYGSRNSALASAYGADRAASASQAASAASSRASIRGSELGALASIFGSRNSALANIFGSQSAGLTSGFNTQTGALSDFAGLYGNIGLGTRQQDLDQILGIGGIAANDLASKRSLQASRSGQRNNQMLDFLRFQESVNARNQSAQLTREQMQNAFNIAQLQGDNSLALSQLNQPSSWDRFINAGALLGSVYGNYRNN